MRSIIQKGLFLLAVWVYFAFCVKAHLLFVEGMQLFLYTGDYALDTCLRPGGLCNYISRFIIQFYHDPWLGALLTGLLLLALQSLVSRLAGEKRKEESGLSFIPSFFYLCLLSDMTLYTINGLVALIFALLAVLIYCKSGNPWLRSACGLFFPPLLWFTVGGVAIPAVILMISMECLNRNTRWFIPLFSVVAAGVLTVLAAPHAAPSLNNPALLYGSGYTRFIEKWHPVFWILWAVLILVILGLRHVRPVQKTAYGILLTVVVFAMGAGALAACHKTARENVLRYYFAIHQSKWEKAISMAEKKIPSDILSLNALNLALAATDQAGSRMFEFPQSTSTLKIFSQGEGLLFSAETLFHLGFINEAQRLSHEYMESIPDRQLSSLLVAQMAETSLIAGQTAVARKYLGLLQHTLFYRKAAKNLDQLARDPRQVASHPFYGAKQDLQPREDFSSDFANLDNMLARMVMQRPGNRIAVNYFFMYLMIHKKVDALHQLFPPRPYVPRHYQELIAWARTVQPGRYPAYEIIHVDTSVTTGLNHLLSEIKSGNSSPEALDPRFAHTYWFYLLYM